MQSITMKSILIILVLLIVIVCLCLVYISMTSRPVKVGLVEGRLGTCGSKPNCVNSEYDGKNHISPINLRNLESGEQWDAIVNAVVSSGGKIAENDGNYMWVEFPSQVFRFVDDLELRIDKDKHELHIRSAARSGTLDFGVNRKRVEMLRSKLE